MIKSVLSLVVSALLFWSAAAQSVSSEEDKVRLSGNIVEAGPDSPLSLCIVSILSSDGKIAAKAFSLEDGSFQVYLEKGNYEVLIEKLGYRSTRRKIIIGNEDLSLGEIVLEIGEELDAASVESSSLISRNGTRITYDVSKDPDAAKISIAEMASRIPSLQQGAKRGNLEFNLKPISKILIDEQENGLINEKRQYPMEFIKANHLKTIEIVLPGDPEYNNSDPIMLITLAKKLPYGFAGQVQISSDTKNSHNPTIDIVANTPLIGVGAGYGYTFSGAPALTNETIRQMGDITIDNYSTSSQKTNGHSFSTNVFRSFDDVRIKVKGRLSGTFSDALNLSESRTQVLDLEGKLIKNDQTSAVGHSTSPFRLNGAVSITGDFGKERSKIRRLKNSWGAEYAYLENQSETTTDYSSGDSDYTNNASKEHRATVSLTMKELVVKPFAAGISLKSGYYNRYFTSNSVSSVESRGLDYRQQVGFLDAMLLSQAINNKLTLSLRLKGEFVANKGSFLISEESFPLDWNEFNILPITSVMWSFKRSSLGLSYTKNVNRPSINQLNPYIDHSNPYYLATGNPKLKGSATNIVSLNYATMPANIKWVQGFSTNVSWSGSNNTIARIVTADSDGTAISTYANIGHSNSLAMSFMAMLTLSQQISMNIIASYTRTWATLPGDMTNTYDYPRVQAGLKWSPKWFELNGTFVLQPSINSVQSATLVMEPLGELSISRYFKKPHIGISVIVTDVFHAGGKKESVIIGDNFTQFNHVERRGRTFGLHVYWRFGQFRSVENVEVKAYDM